MSDFADSFSEFTENFKMYEDKKKYDELEKYVLTFNAKMLELENVNETSLIVKEMNTISSKMLVYGTIAEAQSRILQKLSDEFDMWYAEKYLEVEKYLKSEFPKEKFTESYKDNFIKTENKGGYLEFQEKLRDEKYRLGILKKVCSAIDSYSMKLHSIFKYRSDMDKSNM
jgi:hypothetical protein